MVGCITCSPGQCFLVFQCVAGAEEGITHKMMIQPNLYRRRPSSLAGRAFSSLTMAASSKELEEARRNMPSTE